MHTNAIPILNLTYVHSAMLRQTIIVAGIISCAHDTSTFVSASVDRQGYMHTTSLLCAVLLIHCWCPMLRLLQFFLVRRSTAVWVGVWSQISISFFLTCLLLFNSILWCRGVKDRVLIITCSPIVSFTIAHLVLWNTNLCETVINFYESVTCETSAPDWFRWMSEVHCSVMVYYLEF